MNQPPLNPTPQDTFKLLLKLAELIKELHQCADEFKTQNNDEAHCSTWAAAERLKEVINEWIAETRQK